MSRMESVRKGDLLLHDDIQFGSSPHIIHATPPDLAPASPFSEVSVGASGEGGLYYLNAAELAAIESKKTREKLKNKAERVSCCCSCLAMPVRFWSSYMLQIGGIPVYRWSLYTCGD